MKVKKQIEKVWWISAIGTIMFGILGQMHTDPSISVPSWTIGVFALSFFGFLFSSLAWLWVNHFEYVSSLKKKVEELEKQQELEI